jgi:hypothetical protein
MSFFDEGQQPTQVSPRRPEPRRPHNGSVGRPGTVDRQTIRVRQATALGVGILFAILFFVGVRGWLDGRGEQALKAYNQEVTALMTDSDEQVSRPFFEALTGGAEQPNDLQVQVNQHRVAAEADIQRARGFDVPDEMRRAQYDLMLVLNLRAEALQKIAGKLPAALVRRGGGNPAAQAAVEQIAGQMQALLASDVVYSQRVVPFIKQALDHAGIGGQTIKTSRFLPAINWLAPNFVASQLGAEIGGRGGSGGTIKPGLHGHGLTGVDAGGVTLQPAPAVNRIPAKAGLAFSVTFANQGDNDEPDVTIVVRITGAGRPITVRKTVNQTKAGGPAEVVVPLGKMPPVGEPVTIQIQVVPVPGEKNTDNNSQSYTALFTR